MSSKPTSLPSPLPASDRARVYQPFKRVWTPRTPDSSYDSFAGLTPPLPIIQAPLLVETRLDPKTQEQVPVALGLGVTIHSAVYLATVVVSNRSDRVGIGVTIHSGTYTHP
jgi:hypothetical protein